MRKKGKGKKAPFRLALTGPPASGKTTVLKIFQQKGVPVFSADEVVHKLSCPCQPGYHQVLRRLGETFLQKDGALDRRLLLSAMLKDPKIKAVLEGIFHPLVKERLLDWFERHSTAPLLVAEIPLLYQAGWEDLFEEVLFVTSPSSILKERLTQRLGDPLLAEALLKGYSVTPKKALILNNLDLSKTRAYVNAYLRKHGLNET